MIFLSILILIVVIALPSINQNIRSILYVRISSIIFIYAGALALNAFYIQSIGSGIGIYSGLFQVTTISQLLDAIFYIYSSIYKLINFIFIQNVNSEPLSLLSTILIKNSFLSNRKYFHCSNLLQAEVPPLNDNTSEDDKVFKEIRENSDTMTDAEYIESLSTPIGDLITFSEAFPNFNAQDLSKKQEVIKNSLRLLVKENETLVPNDNSTELFSPLYPLLQNNNPNTIAQIRELSNPNITLYENKFKSSINKVLEENNLLKLYNEYPSLIGYGVPGFGALFIYRAVVKLHAETAFVDENTFKDEVLRLNYLKLRARQVAVFNSVAVSLLVMSLMGISYAIKSHKSHTISNILSNINNNDKSTSIFTLFLSKIKNNKNSKYILYLISGLVMIFLPYSSIFTLSFLNLTTTTLIKVIGLVITNLLILYNLFTVLFINKYSSNNSINHSKYLPKFLRNYLIELYDISKIKDVNIIQDMILKNTIICLMLQTVVILLLFIIT